MKESNLNETKRILIINPLARNGSGDLIPALQSEANKYKDALETCYLQVENSKEVAEKILQILLRCQNYKKILLIRHGGDGSHRKLFEIMTQVPPELFDKTKIAGIGGGSWDTFARRLGWTYSPADNLKILMDILLGKNKEKFQLTSTPIHPIKITQNQTNLYCLFVFFGPIATIINKEYTQKRGIIRGLQIFCKGILTCCIGWPKHYKEYLHPINISDLIIDGNNIDHRQSLLCGASRVCEKLVPALSPLTPFGNNNGDDLLPQISFRSYNLTIREFIGNFFRLATDSPLPNTLNGNKISASASNILITISGEETDFVQLNVDGDPKTVFPNIPISLEVFTPALNYLSLQKI